MEMLLLSNAKNKNESILQFAMEDIRKMLGDNINEIIFIPFARVLMNEDEYTSQVQEAFFNTGYKVKKVTEGEVHQNIKEAKCILVGGGNTFNLLNSLYSYDILNILRERIISGTKYISWSAGSNIVSPTIKTTNDMPIIEPPSLNSLNLIPFQINPHFIDETYGKSGKNREHRLNEYMVANPESKVLGMRNGTYLKIVNNQITILGDPQVRLYEHNSFTEIDPETMIEFTQC